MTKKAIKKIHSYLHVSSFQTVSKAVYSYPYHKTQNSSSSSYFLFHFSFLFEHTTYWKFHTLQFNLFPFVYSYCWLLVVLNIHLHYVYICDVYVFFAFLNNAAAISSSVLLLLLTNDNTRKAETKLKRNCANLRFLRNEHFPESTGNVRSPTEDKNTSQRSKKIGSPSPTPKGLGWVCWKEWWWCFAKTDSMMMSSRWRCKFFTKLPVSSDNGCLPSCRTKCTIFMTSTSTIDTCIGKSAGTGCRQRFYASITALTRVIMTVLELWQLAEWFQISLLFFVTSRQTEWRPKQKKNARNRIQWSKYM